MPVKVYAVSCYFVEKNSNRAIPKFCFRIAESEIRKRMRKVAITLQMLWKGVDYFL